MLVYLDSSALQRIESGGADAVALRRYLGDDGRLVTCRIAELDLGSAPALAAVAMREIDSTLLRSAADLKSTERDLATALHLAAAVELRSELEGFVTYDDRIAAAARALRLPVVAPV